MFIAWNTSMYWLKLFKNNYIWSFQLSLLSHLAANYLNAGWESQRHGTAHASIVPYQAFRCQDGERIVVAAANDQFFKELCTVCYVRIINKIQYDFLSYLKIIDLPELVNNDLYKSNKLRVTNRIQLIAILSNK